MVLVGNKTDLESKRQVSTKDGQLLAEEFGNIPFIECSALKGINCDEVFHKAVKEIRILDEKKAPKDKDSGFFHGVIYYNETFLFYL